jgi:hypothetical protein
VVTSNIKRRLAVNPHEVEVASKTSAGQRTRKKLGRRNLEAETTMFDTISLTV